MRLFYRAVLATAGACFGSATGAARLVCANAKNSSRAASLSPWWFIWAPSSRWLFLYRLGEHSQLCGIGLVAGIKKCGSARAAPTAAKVERNGLCYRADILTEYIEGATSLVDLLKQRALSDDELASVALEIAKMHKACVNHTDLNIHNILFDKEGLVWLIDFDKCYKIQQKRLEAGQSTTLRAFVLKESKNSRYFGRLKILPSLFPIVNQYLSC